MDWNLKNHKKYTGLSLWNAQLTSDLKALMLGSTTIFEKEECHGTLNILKLRLLFHRSCGKAINDIFLEQSKNRDTWYNRHRNCCKHSCVIEAKLRCEITERQR